MHVFVCVTFVGALMVNAVVAAPHRYTHFGSGEDSDFLGHHHDIFHCHNRDFHNHHHGRYPHYHTHTPHYGYDDDAFDFHDEAPSQGFQQISKVPYNTRVPLAPILPVSQFAPASPFQQATPFAPVSPYPSVSPFTRVSPFRAVTSKKEHFKPTINNPRQATEVKPIYEEQSEEADVPTKATPLVASSSEIVSATAADRDEPSLSIDLRIG